jgi:hypothetical protein
VPSADTDTVLTTRVARHVRCRIFEVPEGGPPVLDEVVASLVGVPDDGNLVVEVPS